MKANRAPRKEDHAARRTPDGGQMLLLAGFLLAGTAIIALGALTVVQRSETQLTAQEHESMLGLFLNTRERAIDYFELVDANDTAISVEKHLQGYLASQFQTANSLNLDMNATLAGEDSRGDLSEGDFLSGGMYATHENGQDLWDVQGSTCYSGVSDDGRDDGLITDEDGKVLAAIFWLNIDGLEAALEEYIVIDVPSTEPSAAC